jgi:hypothetical protein
MGIWCWNEILDKLNTLFININSHAIQLPTTLRQVIAEIQGHF